MYKNETLINYLSVCLSVLSKWALNYILNMSRLNNVLLIVHKALKEALDLFKVFTS